MARVLVATYTNFPKKALDPFRQSFVDALVREGNNVLLFKTNDFFADYTRANCLLPTVDKTALDKTLSGFVPNLVISFNHSGLYDGLHNLLACPIGIWLVDGPAYMCDRDGFKANSSRYDVFSPVRAFARELAANYGYDQSRVQYLPFCSDFNNENYCKTQNIVFVGTFFAAPDLRHKLQHLAHNRELWSRVRALFESYQIHGDTCWADRLQTFRLAEIFNDQFDEAGILNLIAINRRVKILEAVEDLGLAIHGTDSWLDALSYSIEVAMAFDPRAVLFKQELETIYNSSHITINVSHTQARGGLPWRVFDAMASGSVLVSNDAEDLKELFGEVEIPTYETPSEARSVCQSLLADARRRESIIAACNDAVAKGHRFKHRLMAIGETFKLNLLPGGMGKLSEVDPQTLSEVKENGKVSMLAPGQSDKLSERIANGANQREISFTVEIFYSDDLSFGSTRTKRAKKLVGIGNRLTFDFEFESAPEFFRFDLGSYFSHHGSPKMTIALAQRDGDQAYQLDFEHDLIDHCQFLFENNEIICGFDPRFVFRNPFQGKDIRLHFESTLLSGI